MWGQQWRCPPSLQSDGTPAPGLLRITMKTVSIGSDRLDLITQAVQASWVGRLGGQVSATGRPLPGTALNPCLPRPRQQGPWHSARATKAP